MSLPATAALSRVSICAAPALLSRAAARAAPTPGRPVSDGDGAVGGLWQALRTSAHARGAIQKPRVSVATCARRDLNPHVRGHWNLNPARMPISPLARG